MVNSKLFFRETARTASFAFREYFRPLVAVARFFSSGLTPPEVVEPTPEEKANLDAAEALLRERLAKSRHHEKHLLTLNVISALASMLGVVIVLMRAFELELGAIL